MSIFLSPLNPINFNKTSDEKSGELQREYIQQFSREDTIVLQFIGEDNIQAKLIIGAFSTIFQKQTNGTTTIYTASVKASDLAFNTILGVQIQITAWDAVEYYNSEGYIEIADCENTKVISYRHETSINPFNTYFNGDIVFQLRLPMGFKSNSVKERLASETFRNQNQKLQILYSYPYQSKTLILGDGLGIPTWMASLINRIFSLSHVYIDGTRYVRGDESVPEPQGGIDGYPFHIYTMTVENYSEYDDVLTVLGDFNDDFNEDYMI